MPVQLTAGMGDAIYNHLNKPNGNENTEMKKARLISQNGKPVLPASGYASQDVDNQRQPESKTKNEPCANIPPAIMAAASAMMPPPSRSIVVGSTPPLARSDRIRSPKARARSPRQRVEPSSHALPSVRGSDDEQDSDGGRDFGCGFEQCIY